MSSPELEWHREKGYRWAEIPSGSSESYGFELLSSSRTGIEFNNIMTEEELSDNRHYLNGSGVAAGDIDGDGLVDLYFAGLKNRNRLYKNLGGMQFRDITAEAGVAQAGHYSTGAVFADVDGDGHLDLLVTSIYKDNALYLNDGEGNFELSENSGLGAGEGSTTMALADIDGDGDLDLYIAKYKEKSVKDIYSTEELAWNNILNEPYTKQQQTGPYTLVPPFDEHYQIFMTDDNRLAGLAETGEEDVLYLNHNGSFKKVVDTENVFLDEEGRPHGLPDDWGLTAKFQDLNAAGKMMSATNGLSVSRSMYFTTTSRWESGSRTRRTWRPSTIRFPVRYASGMLMATNRSMRLTGRSSDRRCRNIRPA